MSVLWFLALFGLVFRFLCLKKPDPFVRFWCLILQFVVFPFSAFGFWVWAKMQVVFDVWCDFKSKPKVAFDWPCAWSTFNSCMPKDTCKYCFSLPKSYCTWQGYMNGLKEALDGCLLSVFITLHFTTMQHMTFIFIPVTDMSDFVSGKMWS